MIGRSAGWWIGDWLRYGNSKFGERYVRASRITGYDTQTLMNMVYVASTYDVAQRRPNLSFSHHAELAALPAAERDRWLDLAEANRLSVRCLREELRRVHRLEAATETGEAATGEHASKRGAALASAEDASARCPHCGGELGESPPAPVPGRAGRDWVGARGAA